MANKKLKVGGGELNLPAKNAKGDKKPKWQAKTGKGRAVIEQPLGVEHTEQVGESPAPVVEEPTPVAEQPVELPSGGCCKNHR